MSRNDEASSSRPFSKRESDCNRYLPARRAPKSPHTQAAALDFTPTHTWGDGGKPDHYSGNILNPLGLDGCVRVSMCHYNSRHEIAQFLTAMKEIAGPDAGGAV